MIMRQPIMRIGETYRSYELERVSQKSPPPFDT